MYHVGMKKIALLLTLALLASCAVQPVPPAAVTLETIPTLDAAQIRALSEAQIDALGVENTVGLEAATAQLRAQTVIRFPNYNDTLFVAISITYERYLSDYYRQTNGPDWSDNGCSGPTPPVIFDATACRQHDFGYRNVSKYAAGRNETVRKLVDSRFLSNMYLNCDRRWSRWYQAPLRVACKADALVFYGAVRNFGSSAFYESTQTY